LVEVNRQSKLAELNQPQVARPGALPEQCKCTGARGIHSEQVRIEIGFSRPSILGE
jgi:hypothetical protein